MTDFDQLQKSWKEQPIQKPTEESFKAVKKAIHKVVLGQKITNMILLATTAVLVFFFLYIRAIEHIKVAIAISIMISVLLTRVLIESRSIGRLKLLAATLNIKSFKEKLGVYYKNRIIVHLVVTPLLFITYWISFWALLPDFKANLSKGFYTYVLVSGISVFVILGLFIATEIRKELRKLKELNRQ